VNELISRRELLQRGALASLAVSASSLGILSIPSGAQCAEVSPVAVKKFGASLKGTLILPGDSHYDSARKVWNARFDKHPAIIARCAGTEDIVRAVDFARKNRLAVAVRAGGHSMAGLSTCDDGLVIDLSQLKQVLVDPRARFAQAGPGVTRHELLSALGEHGFVVPLGGCSDTGISGLTLGGGEGDLTAKYGLTLNTLVSAEIVTADGRVIRASADENPDIFWGIRGGGGNLGVVTSFRYRLNALSRVVAGLVAFPMARAMEVFRFYREAFASSPDELMASPFSTTIGREPVCGIGLCYSGEPKGAEKAFAPLDALRNPSVWNIRSLTYLDDNAPFDAGIGCHGTGAFVPNLTDDAICAFVAAMQKPPPFYLASALHLHGAVSRVPVDATAYPLREPGFDCFAWASYREPAQEKSTREWVERFRAAMKPFSRGAYLNNLEDEGSERARESYGPNYGRMVVLKNKYDPTNLFHVNQNVKPLAT
jgi:FAD/FMN-containing dehydrogenase